MCPPRPPNLSPVPLRFVFCPQESGVELSQ